MERKAGCVNQARKGTFNIKQEMQAWNTGNNPRQSKHSKTQGGEVDKIELKEQKHNKPINLEILNKWLELLINRMDPFQGYYL